MYPIIEYKTMSERRQRSCGTLDSYLTLCPTSPIKSDQPIHELRYGGLYREILSSISPII